MQCHKSAVISFLLLSFRDVYNFHQSNVEKAIITWKLFKMKSGVL